MHSHRLHVNDLHTICKAVQFHNHTTLLYVVTCISITILLFGFLQKPRHESFVWHFLLCEVDGRGWWMVQCIYHIQCPQGLFTQCILYQMTVNLHQIWVTSYVSIYLVRSLHFGTGWLQHCHLWSLLHKSFWQPVAVMLCTLYKVCHLHVWISSDWVLSLVTNMVTK